MKKNDTIEAVWKTKNKKVIHYNRWINSAWIYSWKSKADITNYVSLYFFC